MDSDRIKWIQQGTAHPNSQSVMNALNQVWHETIHDERQWNEMSTAPMDETWVQLLCDSGYTTTPFIIVIARYEKERGDSVHSWRDHAADSVFDRTEGIIAWKPWTPPELEFEPYKMLNIEDQIFPGDEFKRPDGLWTALSAQDVASWEKITGKPMTHQEGDLPVRRRNFIGT